MFTFSSGIHGRTVTRVAALATAGVLAVSLAACSSGRGGDTSSDDSSSGGTSTLR